MTEEEIIAKLGIERAETHHPAWRPFVHEMADKQYGWDPLNQAWYFFKAGWEATEHTYT